MKNENEKKDLKELLKTADASTIAIALTCGLFYLVFEQIYKIYGIEDNNNEN